MEKTNRVHQPQLNNRFKILNRQYIFQLFNNTIPNLHCLVLPAKIHFSQLYVIHHLPSRSFILCDGEFLNIHIRLDHHFSDSISSRVRESVFNWLHSV